MIRTVAVRKLVRLLGYDVVRVRSRSAEDSVSRTSVLPQIPRAEVQSAQRILREYVARFGEEPGQYRSFKSAARYLDETRMRKQWGTVDFARKHGIEFNGRRILDVGSRTGYLLTTIRAFAPKADLFGFDPSPKSETLAPMLCPSATFTRDLEWETEDRFDLIFCTQVLEHMADPDSFLQKLSGILNAGGGLILTVPDGRYNFLEAGKFSEKNGAYEGHVNFWSPENWRHWLERSFSSREVITEVNDQIGNLAFVKVAAKL